MKKLFLFSLFTMVLSLAFSLGVYDKAEAAEIIDSGSCGTNVTYTLDSDGLLTISGSGKMNSYSSASSVPWYSNRASVKTVVISNNVTSIGSFAFCRYSSLTSITIPDSVESVGERAFESCNSLKGVYITDIASWCNIDFDYLGDTGRYVEGANPLMYSSCLYVKEELISELKIPDNITEIKQFAFFGCDTLTSVAIGDDVTTIGNYAFYRCSGLASVTIGDSVTHIGSYAFSSCSSLTNVNIPDNVTRIGSCAFVDCNSLGRVYITDISAWCNIDFDDYYANPLYYADELYINNEIAVNIVIDDGVKQIPACAFSCDSIESIVIPNSVTSIGMYAFDDCIALTSIIIPNRVVSIGSSAFVGCRSLTNVTIEGEMSNIGEFAFFGCRSLKSINIPDSVKSIGYYTFAYCNGLTSVTIGNSVTSIGEFAFFDCCSLISINIPDSLASVGKYAFYDCNSLSVIEYGGSEAEWDEVYIGNNNDPILNAQIRFNSALASDPAENELEVKQVEGENSGVYTFSVLPEKVADGCFVYAAAYGENGKVKKLVSLSKTELLTSGESKINVNKDDTIEYVVFYVWTGELKPVSQSEKVDIS